MQSQPSVRERRCRFVLISVVKAERSDVRETEKAEQRTSSERRWEGEILRLEVDTEKTGGTRFYPAEKEEERTLDDGSRRWHDVLSPGTYTQ